MLGILLIDKPLGVSSHDVVNLIRRRLETKRVGHAGTLDPLATGLLVMAVGPATRFLQYLPLEPKVYIAEVTFGRSTATFDAEGTTTAESMVPTDLAVLLEAAMPRFRGLIQQTPPMFSAVKVGGKPLYRYARQGQSVERKSRTVHIADLTILSVENDVAHLRVVCSGGTYVRTLAHDLGVTVGCGAFLSSLKRTSVGDFHLEGAVLPDAATRDDLVPLNLALGSLPQIVLTAEQMDSVRAGKPTEISGERSEGAVALVDPWGSVFGIARVVGNFAHPECVIPSEAMDGVA